MRDLPVNMLPVAQLEAILGAILAQMTVVKSDFECKILGNFEGIETIGI